MTSQSEILEKITKVMVESFDLDPADLQPSAHLFEELGLDSIDAIDLVVGLEEATGLEVSQDELVKIRIVQDIVELVAEKLAKA